MVQDEDEILGVAIQRLKEEAWYEERRNWDGPNDVRVYRREFEEWWEEPGGGMDQALETLALELERLEAKRR